MDFRSEDVRVKGWPLVVVVEGVTREFFSSCSSPEVLETSDLTLSTIGPKRGGEKESIRWITF